MNYRLEIEIPGLPKTTNGNARAHWRRLHAEAKKWQRLVLLQVNGKAPSEPLTRAKLTCTRFSSCSPDADGLVSSFKHSIDGLVRAGVLLDDKIANIGMPEYRWEKVPPKKGKIQIIVESAS